MQQSVSPTIRQVGYMLMSMNVQSIINMTQTLFFVLENEAPFPICFTSALDM
jgi:hypothetical protein